LKQVKIILFILEKKKAFQQRKIHVGLQWISKKNISSWVDWVLVMTINSLHMQ
jgi:hypothetical protein